MRIDNIVINASPLISLFCSGQAKLLPALFREIIVPDAVWREVTESLHQDAASRELNLAEWPRRTRVTVLPQVARCRLGAGESGVLSFALAHTGFYVVVDDRAARRCARHLDIPLLGTGGVLVLAKPGACCLPWSKPYAVCGRPGYGCPMMSSRH